MINDPELAAIIANAHQQLDQAHQENLDDLRARMRASFVNIVQEANSSTTPAPSPTSTPLPLHPTLSARQHTIVRRLFEPAIALTFATLGWIISPWVAVLVIAMYALRIALGFVLKRPDPSPQQPQHMPVSDHHPQAEVVDGAARWTDSASPAGFLFPPPPPESTKQ